MREKQMKDPGLTNKTALVTGASRGIGRAIALAFAEAGAQVLVHYGRSAQEARVSRRRVSNPKADGQMRSRRTWELRTARRCSPSKCAPSSAIDWMCLCSTPESARRHAIADYTVEDFDNLFATNVRSPFFLVQQLLPILGDGSNIVVISSIGARAVVGQARLGQPFDSCLRLDQRSTRDSGQKLGRHSWAAGHSRKCCRARCDRHGYVEFHED